MSLQSRSVWSSFRMGSKLSHFWTFGQVPELEATKLQAIAQAVEAGTSQALIIDVRTRDEYVHGHVKGARNAGFLPPWSFGQRVQPLIEGLPKNKELHVICLSAHRSIGALKWLQEQGYTNVRQLQGGMQDWRSKKLPEASGEEPQG